MVTPITKTIASEIEAEARKEIADERAKKAKELLKLKFRELAGLEQAVKNCLKQLDDLREQIAEGSV